MKTSELQQRLDSLRAELNRTAGLDEEARRQLHGLVDEIERGVAAPDSETAAGESSAVSVQDRIAAAMTDFEVKHPQLATSLSQLVDQLALMGI